MFILYILLQIILNILYIYTVYILKEKFDIEFINIINIFNDILSISYIETFNNLISDIFSKKYIYCDTTNSDNDNNIRLDIENTYPSGDVVSPDMSSSEDENSFSGLINNNKKISMIKENESINNPFLENSIFTVKNVIPEDLIKNKSDSENSAFPIKNNSLQNLSEKITNPEIIVKDNSLKDFKSENELSSKISKNSEEFVEQRNKDFFDKFGKNISDPKIIKDSIDQTKKGEEDFNIKNNVNLYKLFRNFIINIPNNFFLEIFHNKLGRDSIRAFPTTFTVNSENPIDYSNYITIQPNKGN